MPSIVVLVAALLCLIGTGCSQEKATPTASGEELRKSGTLRYFDLFNLDVRDVPWMMALDELAAQGYSIEKTYLTSSALLADALVRGSADLAMMNNQTAWIAISKGAPIRTITEFTANTTKLAVPIGVQSCGDLDGRRLAVPSTGGMNTLLLKTYLEQNCPNATPQFLVIPESTARAAALLAGEIDAEVVPGEELIKLQLQAPGRFHSIMSYAESFPLLHAESFHVRRQWAQENPELLKDFLRALLRAQRQVAEDAELLRAEAVRRLSLEPAAARAIGESHLKDSIWDPNGGLTTENIQDTIDFLTNAGAISPGLRTADVADLSYLNAVLQEIDRR